MPAADHQSRWRSEDAGFVGRERGRGELSGTTGRVALPCSSGRDIDGPDALARLEAQELRAPYCSSELLLEAVGAYRLAEQL